jgi:hypothetical protein
MEEATLMTIVREEDDQTLFLYEGYGIEAYVFMSEVNKTGWRKVHVDPSHMFSRDLAKKILFSIEEHLILYGWGKNNGQRDWRWTETKMSLNGFMYETNVRVRSMQGEEE